MLAMAMLFVFPASPLTADDRIYTNKDLERYTNTKSQEAPVKNQEAPVKGQEAPLKYSGKKVTLDFSDANLTAVLSLLSDIAKHDGYTLTADPRIQGKITLKMTNVPWDQVLDFLTENYHLVKVVKEKTITIAPRN